MEDLDRFITIAESAPILHLSRAKVYKLAKDGQFPVPVRKVGGKQVVSLRRLVEFVHADDERVSA